MGIPDGTDPFFRTEMGDLHNQFHPEGDMKKTSTLTVLAVATSAALLFLAPPTVAQVNDEIYAGVQFNFSTPGARSLALGGAFLALANDATAAFANPAGLTVLSRPEISIEGRNFTFTTLFSDQGHALGDPTGIGVDTVAGLQFGESENDTSGLSYLSYVHPIGNARVAFYRHELANFEAAFQSQGPFFTAPGVTGRTFPVQATMDLEMENLGFSLAYLFSESFSFGLGVSFYDFSLDALTQRFETSLAGGTSPGGFFGPPDFSPSNVFAAQVHDGDDDDVGFNAGFLWKLSRVVSLGAVYRQGPDFQFVYQVVCGPVDPLGCSPLAGQVTAPFNVPDVWGVGFAFHPTDTLTITLDYDNVEYTALTADFVIFPEAPGTEPTDFVVDDADEVHMGLEYVFAQMKYPLALRVGAWHDPAHQTRFIGDNQFLQTLWASGDEVDDEVHYSAGFGLVFGQRFQLDAAVDLSDRVDTGSLSAVLRF
jgi:long-chain fatty acid transport protein